MLNLKNRMGFMRVKVLASGSTGNCTYVETLNHKILIDVGISKKGIEQCLESIDRSVHIYTNYCDRNHSHTAQ